MALQARAVESRAAFLGIAGNERQSFHRHVKKLQKSANLRAEPTGLIALRQEFLLWLRGARGAGFPLADQGTIRYDGTGGFSAQENAG